MVRNGVNIPVSLLDLILSSFGLHPQQVVKFVFCHHIIVVGGAQLNANVVSEIGVGPSAANGWTLYVEESGVTACKATQCLAVVTADCGWQVHGLIQLCSVGLTQ